MALPHRIAFYAYCFIDAVVGRPSGERVQQLLRRASSGAIQPLISRHTIAELEAGLP